MDKVFCRQCGYKIVEGGRLGDQEAHEHGFCGSGCERVYETLKALDRFHAGKDAA